MMFLALKEIKHEKLRYGLITLMFILISYLIMILMGMMLGLAHENTAAIDSWGTQTVFLSKNSNDSLSQSLISQDQRPNYRPDHMATIGVAPAVAKQGKNKENVQFVGLNRNEFIFRDKLQLVAGREAHNNREVVVDQSLKNKGFKRGDYLRLNSQGPRFKIVGFVKNAQLSVAPVVYGSLTSWRQLRSVQPNIVGSALISDQAMTTATAPKLEHYTVKQFVNKLPGYSAQNTTFTFMIGFLMIISLVIIAVFLYILTIQKLPHFAVLRAQGIPAKNLIGSTIYQSLLLVAVGDIGGILLTLLTKQVLPEGLPMEINWLAIAGLSGALLVLGIIGALLPVRVIAKIDPVAALNQ